MFDHSAGITILIIFNWIALFYFIGINGIYSTLLFMSFFEQLRVMRKTRYEKWRRLFQSPFTPPVSILVPAYNEELTIAESISSLLRLRYPHYEVVLVNDGSTDRTLEVLIENFGLEKAPTQVDMVLPCKPIGAVYRSSRYPDLVVVNKENGGKADALNAGINVARYSLICAVDADSLIEADALLHIVQPFLESPRTVAVGGIIRVANGCLIDSGFVVKVGLPKGFLPLIQTVEYMRAFLFGRTGWSALHSLLIISGAFGMFRRDIVIDVGGYKHKSVGEDMELIVRMHRYLRENNRKYHMYFLPDPVCWTQVPESLKVLGRQRNRWQRGLIDTMFSHRKMLLNPRYGAVGLLAFPYFIVFEMFSPIMEALGFMIVPITFGFGIVDWKFFVAFLSVSILLGTALSTGSVILEEFSLRRYPRSMDLLKLVLVALLENFGYRQIHTWWRLRAFFDYFRRNLVWGRMERKSFRGG